MTPISSEEADKFEDEAYTKIKDLMEKMTTKERREYMMMNIGPYIEAAMFYENPGAIAIDIMAVLRTTLHVKKTGELPDKLKGHEDEIIRKA